MVNLFLFCFVISFARSCEVGGCRCRVCADASLNGRPWPCVLAEYGASKWITARPRPPGWEKAHPPSFLDFSHAPLLRFDKTHEGCVSLLFSQPPDLKKKSETRAYKNRCLCFVWLEISGFILHPARILHKSAPLAHDGETAPPRSGYRAITDRHREYPPGPFVLFYSDIKNKNKT